MMTTVCTHLVRSAGPVAMAGLLALCSVLGTESRADTWVLGEPAPWEELLGVQIGKARVISAASDEDFYYLSVAGQPAKLVVAERGTLDVRHVLDVPGAEFVWATETAMDGSVYLGSAPNGHLHRYTDGEIEDLGRAPGNATVVWCLAANPDGGVTGGTYPGAHVFSYDPAEDIMTDHGNVAPGQDYVRSISFSPTTGMLYAGIGTQSVDILRIDPETFASTSILPESYREPGFIYTMHAAADKVFAFLNNRQEILVIDESTTQLQSVIDEESIVVLSDVQPGGSRVYFTGDWSLCYYDTATSQTGDAGHEILMDARTLDWVGPLDDPRLSYAIGNGEVGEYHVASDTLTTGMVNLPKEPTDIRSLITGPGGVIVSAGYLTGGVGLYDPVTGDHVQYEEIGQAENMVALGDVIYFGVYPGARLYHYDTIRPWQPAKPTEDETDSRFNPHLVFRLDEYEQDRPFGMAVNPALGEIYLGTVPDYGRLGGALTVYETCTGNWAAYRDIIPKQSIVCLTAASSGTVYGGTTIWGGLGIPAIESEAQFFAWDTTSRTLEFAFVPVPGKTAVTEVAEGPNGNIYGWAEGVLFIYSPEEEKIVETRDLVSYGEGSRIYWDAKMQWAQDGLFYGTIQGDLFSLDPETLEYTEFPIQANRARLFTIGQDGDFYYSDGGYNLTRYHRRAITE